MSFTKVLKNTTSPSAEVTISDTGVSIAGGDTYTIPEIDYLLWAASTDITTPVNSGDITVNDGTSDLSAALGLDLLKAGQDSEFWNAGKIKGVTVDDTDIADGKVLKYNSTSGNLEYEVDNTAAGGNSAYKAFFERNGTVNKKRFLHYGKKPSNQRPFIVASATNITEISGSLRSSGTVTFSIRKNGTEVATLVFTSAKKAVTTGLSLSVASLDEIDVLWKSGSGKDPAVDVVFG